MAANAYELAEVGHYWPVYRGHTFPVPCADAWAPATRQSGEQMARHRSPMFLGFKSRAVKAGLLKYDFDGAYEDGTGTVQKYMHCSGDHAILCRKVAEPLHVQLTADQTFAGADHCDVHARTDGELMISTHALGGKNLTVANVKEHIQSELCGRNLATRQRKLIFSTGSKRLYPQNVLAKVYKTKTKA